MDRRPLISYLRVQRDHERQMLSILRQSVARMDGELRRLNGRTGIGAAVRRDQVAMTQAAIHREMAGLWRQLGDEIAAGRQDAAAAAVESVYPGDALRRVLPADDLDYMLRSARETARRGAATVESRVGLSQVPLAESVYHNEQLAMGKIDEIVNSALASGASAAELARDVRAYIRPDVRGGVRYAALRLGRTELNNAFHAQQVQEGIKTPWTLGLKWELSGSHPRPDECNEYADNVHYEGGDAGVFKPEDVPAKPHPNCLCFTTPVVDSRDEFVRKFQSGEYDKFLDEEFPGISPAQARLNLPTVSPVSRTPIHKIGSDELNKQFAAAERQRKALADARYISKGKRRGHFNPETGYDVPGAGAARQNYSESLLNQDMNLLKRDPKAFAAQHADDPSWIEYVAEQNSLLEGLFKKNAIREDVTVARHMTGDFSGLKEGGFMADPGFLSTTTDLKSFVSAPSAAFEEAIAAGQKDWTFIIRARKNTPALPGAEYQKEIILGPGTRQRVLSIDQETRTVYTEVV